MLQPIQLSRMALSRPFGKIHHLSILYDCVVLTKSTQAGAIAAGNAAVIKPSESTPATSSLLAELFPKYLDPTLYAVVNGAVSETTKVSFATLPSERIMS